MLNSFHHFIIVPIMKAINTKEKHTWQPRSLRFLKTTQTIQNFLKFNKVITHKNNICLTDK
jgi:hypothetical protein